MVGQGSNHPTWSWGLAGPEGWGSSQTLIWQSHMELGLGWAWGAVGLSARDPSRAGIRWSHLELGPSRAQGGDPVVPWVAGTQGAGIPPGPRFGSPHMEPEGWWAQGVWILLECGSGSPMQSWGLVGPEGQGAGWSRAVAPRAYGVGTWWACCSFSRSWCGEAFHDLGVQSAEISALPGALPQPSVFPASQQGPNSWSSHSLQLCPSHHLGSSQNNEIDCWKISGCGHISQSLSWDCHFLLLMCPGDLPIVLQSEDFTQLLELCSRWNSSRHVADMRIKRKAGFYLLLYCLTQCSLI
jgi:hypothetical protein